MARQKEAKEKPAPIRCKCGLEPITVKTRHGKWFPAEIPEIVAEIIAHCGKIPKKLLLLLGTI